MRAYSITATAVIAALTLGLNACGDSESPVGADQKSDAESLTDGDGSGAPSLDRDNGAMDGALTARDGDLPTTDQGIPTAEIVTVADLLEHLRATGATAEETGDTVEQPFFTPAGQVLEISDQDVQAFVYDTVEQLKSEARQVMPDGSVIGTTSIRWAAPPRFYATGHLIVLYVGQDRELAGALDRVMGSPFAGDSAGAIVIDPLPPAGPDDQVDERRAPAIVVATSEADIKQLALFTEEPAADELLMDVDLEENAVVAVFRGEMRTAGYDIDIEAVEISGGVAEITVNLTNPAPDMPVATVLTYPVAVHVVPRADIPDAAALDWVAVTDDGEVLARLWPGAVSSGQVEGSSGAIISDGLPIAPDHDVDGAPEPPAVDGNGEPAPSAILEHPDIRGSITSLVAVESDNGVVAQILVEGQIEDDTSVDRATVTITAQTVIVQPGIATFAPITFQELRPGRRVEVQFTGPVRESYPVQATALHVVILE